MNVIEETIDATLDEDGQLRLTQPSRVPPGPVRVTIRVVAAIGAERGLADVIQEIASEQRSRGFLGRTSEDMSAEENAVLVEEAERDAELENARRRPSAGSVFVSKRQSATSAALGDNGF